MQLLSRMDGVDFGITRAVLIHGEIGRAASTVHRFATIHDVQSTATGPQIGAGVLLGEQALHSLVRGLLPERKLTYLDDRVLAMGDGVLLWWKRPSIEMMWFNTDGGDGLGSKCGPAPQPGLVFCATRQSWSVWAVAGDARPGLDTTLMQSPHYNVNNAGVICAGTAQVPDGCLPSDIAAYERAFFGSRFTHPNVVNRRHLTRFRGGANKLWLSMLSGRHARFPDHHLVPTKLTIAALIDRLSVRGE